MFRERWSVLLERFDLPYSEFLLLDRCARSPAMASELAQAIGVTPAGITDILDRLERRHLVLRVAHPTDRRAVLVRLTPAGERVYREARTTLRTVVRELEERMTPGELQALSSGLAALTKALERDAPRLEGRS